MDQHKIKVENADTPTSSQLPQERGNRIIKLRESLGISRRKFSIRHNIKPTTLGTWEQGRFGGLTPKGGLQLIEAFKKEGLSVTLEWLLDGKGLNPLQMNAEHPRTLSNPTNAIIQELQLFHQLNSNAVDAIIPDNSVEPCFFKDDMVAGIRQFEAKIDSIIGSVCIVQLENGQVLVRKLNKGEKPGYYTLICTNPKTTGKNLKNVKLFSAARIIWHRRPN